MLTWRRVFKRQLSPKGGGFMTRMSALIKDTWQYLLTSHALGDVEVIKWPSVKQEELAGP